MASIDRIKRELYVEGFDLIHEKSSGDKEEYIYIKDEHVLAYQVKVTVELTPIW